MASPATQLTHLLVRPTLVETIPTSPPVGARPRAGSRGGSSHVARNAAFLGQRAGSLAQIPGNPLEPEVDRLTRERSLVRTQPRPLKALLPAAFRWAGSALTKPRNWPLSHSLSQSAGGLPRRVWQYTACSLCDLSRVARRAPKAQHDASRSPTLVLTHPSRSADDANRQRRKHLQQFSRKQTTGVPVLETNDVTVGRVELGAIRTPPPRRRQFGGRTPRSAAARCRPAGSSGVTARCRDRVRHVAFTGDLASRLNKVRSDQSGGPSPSDASSAAPPTEGAG
jgi:hypothetical protein